MESENAPYTVRVDNRRYTRVETSNLISFLSIDADGRVQRQGMGKALDISQNGLLLESALPVDSEFVSLMSTDPNNQLIEITAQVAYSRRGRTGNYLTGVRFAGYGTTTSVSPRASSRPFTTAAKSRPPRRRPPVDRPSSGSGDYGQPWLYFEARNLLI